MIVRQGSCAADALPALSRSALEVDAIELRLIRPTTEGVLWSSMQPMESSALRRVSCGAEASVGAGTVFLSLALPRIDALGECAPDRILNRLVRPMLKGITRAGAHASYLGRDWISVAHRPAALVGFAHHAETQRVVLEAVVAVRRGFATRDRDSYLGKAPGTLEELAGRAIDEDVLCTRIAEAYSQAARMEIETRALPDVSSAIARPIVSARPGVLLRSSEEAIGQVGIGVGEGGALRFAGEMMISFDALERFEARLAAGEDAAQCVEEIVRPDVALFGVTDANVLVRLARAL